MTDRPATENGGIEITPVVKDIEKLALIEPPNFVDMFDWDVVRKELAPWLRRS